MMRTSNENPSTSYFALFDHVQNNPSRLPGRLLAHQALRAVATD
tara:strand:+ start:708 stop:839 length:132 start_codon:yes stop_codon:yes gene_type:complete